MSKFINAGYENGININKVIAVVNANTAACKRLIKNAKETQMLVDITEGNKTLSALVMENGHVITSPVKAETIRKRLDEN